MALGSFKKVVLGSVAFAIFWILAVFPAVPFLPIGRTAGSILGATLMVIFEVITPEQAYDAINLPVLGLLFGTMVVSIYLERADMFKDLGVLFSWKSWGAKDMLCRICIVSAISSALFTNDTACVFLTEFILKIARENNVRPEPFLLGLASSSNIGSSATPIGNPQNLIIAIQSRISFGEFVLGLLPAVLVGVFVNALILICMFWRLLSDVKEEEDALEELIVQEDSESGPQQSAEESNGLLNRWERLSRKLCIYLGTVGMLVAFLKGVDMSWTALTTALIFVILDFKDAGPCLEKVSYSVLVLFCGMFITVDGFNRTGIPSSFWNLMEPHARIDHASGIAVLAIVILLLSNVASNVPTGEEKQLTWFAGEEADDGVLAGRCYSPPVLSLFFLLPVFCFLCFCFSSASLVSPILSVSLKVCLSFFSSVFRSVSCASFSFSFSFSFVRCLSCVLRCSLCILLVSLCSSSLHALFLVQ